jgi:tetratricopeptide (TPR) repeat protein
MAMEEEAAGVFRPGQYIEAANACLEAGDLQNMEQALARAERELKPHPIIEHKYRQMRACCCAAKKDAVGAEDNLARVRELADEVPSRSAKYETHQAAGRAYLLLGRNESALAELHAAVQLALHPLEKHSTNYWLARAAEAVGQQQEAARLFGLVAADGFDTWMCADARARLNSAPGDRKGLNP